MSQLAALFTDAAEKGQLGRPLIDHVDPAMAACADDKHPELNGVLTPESFQAMLQAWALPARLRLTRGLRPSRLAQPEARDSLFVATLRTAALAASLPGD